MPVTKNGNSIAERGSGIEIVKRHKRASALGDLLPNDVQKLVLIANVEVGCGFVED